MRPIDIAFFLEGGGVTYDMPGVTYDMPAADYHAIAKLSAGYCIRSEQECPAQAWYESALNPERPEEKSEEHLSIGTAAHLAVLEPDKLSERIVLLPYSNYRTRDAQTRRDDALVAGKTPLLLEQFELVTRLAKAIEYSIVRDWFHSTLGIGKSEVVAQWEWDVAGTGVLCKARADRLYIGPDGQIVLIDLKTAESASDYAFQQAMWRDGHHIRAAWYKDGFAAADPLNYRPLTYKFVVISKQPPHLISVKEVDEPSEEWGRRQYRRALREFAEGAKIGNVFREYGEGTRVLGLPSRAEFALAEAEAEGEL
jgi:PDDEXK-like domain of unknown function (DUF3799)